MEFDRNTSRMAITLSPFTLLKTSKSLFDRYSEHYLFPLAVDNLATHANQLNLITHPFRKCVRVRR